MHNSRDLLVKSAQPNVVTGQKSKVKILLKTQKYLRWRYCGNWQIQSIFPFSTQDGQRSSQEIKETRWQKNCHIEKTMRYTTVVRKWKLCMNQVGKYQRKMWFMMWNQIGGPKENANTNQHEIEEDQKTTWEDC